MFRCKPLSAKPRAGRYVRVGHNKMCGKKNPHRKHVAIGKENHGTYHQTLTPSEGPELCG